MNRAALLQKIRNISTSVDFTQTALAVFQYQAANNPLYGRFLELLSVNPADINALRDIPYLPISLFKNYTIKTMDWPSQFIFTSSGTTGQITSQHHLRDEEWYRQGSLATFEAFYGPVNDYCVLGLLPSYLERGDSSLVFMVHEFIKTSKYPESGFFLSHLNHLSERLDYCKKENIPTLLIGVSFALLDFAESNPQDLSHCIVMETGGMKGRRNEMTRGQLHQALCTAFNCTHIHSEYGMTELLSQSYSKRKGLFFPGKTKKVLCRAVTDPFQIEKAGKSGVLNIIDLANVDTCSFIATDDVGRVFQDGSFEVLGRLDGSDVRGCSLMVVD